MSPDTEAVLHHEISQILCRFLVHHQNIPTSDGSKCGFSVWDCRKSHWVRISELTDQSTARTDLRRLQTEAIIQLIKELAPDTKGGSPEPRGAA